MDCYESSYLECTFSSLLVCHVMPLCDGENCLTLEVYPLSFLSSILFVDAFDPSLNDLVNTIILPPFST